MRYLVWGTGKRAEEVCSLYNDKFKQVNIDIVGFVDNAKQTFEFNGKRVYTPSEVSGIEFDYIDIWVINGRESILEQIEKELGMSQKYRNVFDEYIQQTQEQNQNYTGYYEKPSYEIVTAFVDKYGAQQWYKYAYRAFEERKHSYLAYDWIKHNIAKASNILEIACGIGGMLFHLEEDGFSHLSGYDVDVKSIHAAEDLNRWSHGGINFYVADAKTPRLQENYDVMIWVNGMYHLEEYSLDMFYQTHLSALSPKGYIAFDMINNHYNDVPNNQIRTDCWNKEVTQQLPTEYKIRMSKEEVVDISAKYHMELVEYYELPGTVPHDVYIMRRIG